MLRTALCHAIGLATLLAAAAAGAQTWPDKPLRLVVPYAPGAGADQLARAVGEQLGPGLGQTVVVDNRAGAGGTLGADAVAKAPPDGYTIVLGTDATHATNIYLSKKFPYDPVKSFTPIAPAAVNHIVLVVHPSLPVKNVAELIAYAKANPKKLSFGSSGNGSAHHLAGELLNEKAGIDMVHVPYKGGGPAMTDLLGNSIPVLFASYATAKPHIDSGKVRALAVVEDKRLGQLPTIGETVPGYAISSWFAFFGPVNLPPAVTGQTECRDQQGAGQAAASRIARQGRHVGHRRQGRGPGRLPAQRTGAAREAGEGCGHRSGISSRGHPPREDRMNQPRDTAAEGTPLLAIDGAVARITLRRPSLRNSLNDEDLRTLLQHFRRGRCRPRRARAGARRQHARPGAGRYSAPATTSAGWTGQAAGRRSSSRVPDALEALRPITVCAMGGSVYGGATDLVLACDLRIALAGSEWRMPAAALGLHYYPSGLRRYESRFGFDLAKRAFLTAQALPVELLAAQGLFVQLLPAADFDAAVEQLVAQAAALAPLAAQATKRSLNEIAAGRWDEPALRERERLTQAKRRLCRRPPRLRRTATA